MNIQKLWQLRPLFCPFYSYSLLPVLFLLLPYVLRAIAAHKADCKAVGKADCKAVGACVCIAQQGQRSFAHGICDESDRGGGGVAGE